MVQTVKAKMGRSRTSTKEPMCVYRQLGPMLNAYIMMRCVGAAELGSSGLFRFEPASAWAVRYSIPRKRSVFPLTMGEQFNATIIVKNNGWID